MVTLNDIPILQATSVKFLGLTLDRRLIWYPGVKNVNFYRLLAHSKLNLK